MAGRKNSTEISRNILESAWFRWLTIISVAGAFLGLALAFPEVRKLLFQENPVINVRLSSEIPVLGIKRQIEGLNVTYNSRDLVKNNQDIIAVKVIIENIGGASLTPAAVSADDPVGFRFKGAQIIRLSSFSTQSDHLRKLAQPVVNDDSVFVNSSVIMDPGDQMIFDLLLLRKNDSDSTIIPQGKVAGSAKIAFVDQSELQDVSFLSTTFGGGPLSHLARLVTYLFAGIALMAFTAYIGDTFYTYRRNRRKKKRLQLSDEIKQILNDEKSKLIIQKVLINFGYWPLKEIVEMSDEDRLENLERTQNRPQKSPDFEIRYHPAEHVYDKLYYRNGPVSDLLGIVKAKGLLSDKGVIEKSFVDDIATVEHFLYSRLGTEQKIEKLNERTIDYRFSLADPETLIVE